jgi:hypothetical protein
MLGDPANSSTIAIITAAKPAMHKRLLIIFSSFLGCVIIDFPSSTDLSKR